MRYQDLNSSLQSHINTLRSVIGVLVVINFALWYGWLEAKQDARIHIPPDIRSGAIIKANEVFPPNVYAFAGYIFQLLNHWEEDGEQDYGQQIYMLSPYLTPRFQAYLSNDLDIRGRRGELAGRSRIMQPIPGQGYEERRVDILDGDTWVVWLDFQITEYVRGMEVKNRKIRYPLRVVRYNVDPEVNPFGLALDGLAGDGPQALNDKGQVIEDKGLGLVAENQP